MYIYNIYTHCGSLARLTFAIDGGTGAVYPSSNEFTSLQSHLTSVSSFRYSGCFLPVWCRFRKQDEEQRLFEVDRTEIVSNRGKQAKSEDSGRS